MLKFQGGEFLIRPDGHTELCFTYYRKKHYFDPTVLIEIADEKNTLTKTNFNSSESYVVQPITAHIYDQNGELCEVIYLGIFRLNEQNNPYCASLWTLEKGKKYHVNKN